MTNNPTTSESCELSDDELNAASGGIVRAPQDKTTTTSPLWDQALVNNEIITTPTLSFSRP
jgi:hypothetical protein